MSTITVQVNQHTCERCSHPWLSKLTHPGNCPRCKSPYWNSARAARKYEEIYTLTPGETVTIPWPENTRANGTKIHPAHRIVKKLNAEGQSYSVTYNTQGAIVYRRHDEMR